MPDLADVAGPAVRAALADGLVRWVPRQRWFAGKARTVTALRVADVAVLDAGVVDVFADVAYADGGSERYQIPLAQAPPGAAGPPVARIGGLELIDATDDEHACRVLAGLTVGSDRLPTAAGAAIVGHPAAGDGPAGEDSPWRLSAEQSNTSVVFGQRCILKVFRRLEAGLNPDVEVTRSLTAAGFPHAPAQRGALELEAPGAEGTALAVLSDFVVGGQEGWALACAEVARLADDPDAATPLLDRVGDLGRAVAAMHVALRDGFGSTPADRRALEAWAQAMQRQAATVLATAQARAADAAAPVLHRRDELAARLGAVRDVADAGILMRVHGDLHLGQALLDRHGRWQLLDFEGEPARSLAERRAFSTPLRDVAGMLRSFDYASAQSPPGLASAQSPPGLASAQSPPGSYPTGAPAPAVVAWRDEARGRFRDGYAEVARPAGILVADDRAGAALLAAFELDKAVYELGYELANRPAWVPIPLGGILRVLDAARAGTTAMTAPPPSKGEAVARRASTNRRPDWRAAPEEVAALLAGEHQDPHRVLGAHGVDSGAVVRTYRPDAERVEVVVDGAAPVAAERTHDAGFFEAALDSLPRASAYRLRVTYPDGATFELRDPYAFWPTFGEIDLHLAGEGRHEELWRRMGAQVAEVDGVAGTAFAVWAPNARSVRVVADFNSWDGRLHPLRLLGSSGIWELFVPEVGQGAYYKYEIVTAQGTLATRADPYAFATEPPPGTNSRVFASTHSWGDQQWLEARRATQSLTSPQSVYEVHLGSWRHHGDGDQAGGPLGYRELAHALGEHVAALGFTHVELLPVAEHPFGGSWGYQVTGYFAPTARYGTPDDFRYFVDHLHQRGIGVIVDWVPAHFPRDEWALARYDGTALYEHLDPRRGEHPDWGTLVFNFGRNEVRNFLIANALYWIEELHVDGLRVDAVASMLYLDYSRKEGEWEPNPFGGRENLEAVDFLKELNAVVYGRNPDVMMIAEESTAWPAVSRPAYLGGLGFGFKWNMGWMHDTLDYFSHDPIHRRYHHNQLTFALMYAWTENFVLPLSHDEVVHGKRSLLDKMPGDRWQKFANLRALYGYMWAHPGKQLLFMGGEFGQWREWSEERQLDWYLLGEGDHAGLQRLVADLNAVYRRHPALWQLDAEPDGFQWIDANDADQNVLSFLRRGREGEPLVCLSNFSPIPRSELRFGLPFAGDWGEVLNTDAESYGGSNVGNYGAVTAEEVPWHGLPASAEVTLPPLGTVWLSPRR